MAETEPQASETVAQNEKEKTSAHKMDVEAQAADDAAENGGSKSLRDEGDELGLMETPRRSRKSTTPWKKKRKMGRIRLAWVRRVSGRLWRCLITSTNSFVPGLSISISTRMTTPSSCSPELAFWTSNLEITVFLPVELLSLLWRSN